MTIEEVMLELESYANESTKQIFLNHGAKEPLFGVKVGDMKKIVKKVKDNHELALQLFDTGNGDAMYLAGLVADKKKITKDILQDWVEKADWYMISEYTVPWIAVDSGLGLTMGMEWIKSSEESICSAGWATLSSLLTVDASETLTDDQLKSLLEVVRKNIGQSSNRVKYTMNGFLIAAGALSNDWASHAIKIADEIGDVKVNMGDTACKVPKAQVYIQKIIDKGRLGKKKKKARC